MKTIQAIIVLLFITNMPACKKYLEEEPRKQASIQTTAQLEALVDNNTIFVNNASGSAMNYSTDDIELLPAAYTANPGVWTGETLLHYIFDVDQVAGQTSDGFWNSEYKKIFTANLVLYNADKVDGPEEVKNQLKADAHFIRAFSYWQLLNYYCLPYSAANSNAPGVPLKQSVDYAESLARAPLQQVYDFIEKELEAAKSTTEADVNPLKPWRVSKKAVSAMQSRFYLFRGNYEKALQYANEALTSATASLVDFRTLAPGRPQTFSNPTITLNYCELNDWTDVKILYWKEFLYTRLAYNSSQGYFASPSLLDLYDRDNDLRFKLLMIPNSNRRFLIPNPTFYRYTVFNDGKYLPIGPTMGEMLLNKAEALARTGDLVRSMEAVNILRAKRFSVEMPLTATDKADAIKQVLAERRREMPFVMRWFDIRRLNVNDDALDDVTVQHTYFAINNGIVNTGSMQVYTLSPGSKRFAAPINNLEIKNSQDQIIQNQY